MYRVRVGWLVLVAGIATLSVVFVEGLMALGERRRYPPPGRLVDVAGRRVHVLRSGAGAPTVVLDSALAGSCLSWFAVQPEIARFADVVSYDRLGFGWSERAGKPRTVGDMTEELRAMLRAAEIEPPYVLVGHSYGGWIAELFTSRYRDEVAGLVLVDSPHPSEWADPDEQRRRRVRRGARLARLGCVLARLGLLRAAVRAVAWSGDGRRAGERTRVFTLLERTPSEIRGPLWSFWMRPRTLEALASQIDNAPESAAVVAVERRSLGDLPLVVLTAADPSAERLRDQLETVGLSRSSEHAVAKTSGHWIPLEEPELIVEAVRRVIVPVKER